MSLTENVIEVVDLLNDVVKAAGNIAEQAARIRMMIIRLTPTNTMHSIAQRRELALQSYREQYERESHRIALDRNTLDRTMEGEDEIDGGTDKMVTNLCIHTHTHTHTHVADMPSQ
jgi:hypothetical protein